MTPRPHNPETLHAQVLDLQAHLREMKAENKALWAALQRKCWPSARGCGLSAEEMDTRGGLDGMALEAAQAEFKRCGGILHGTATTPEEE